MVSDERIDELMIAIEEDPDVLDVLTPEESIAVHADALEQLANPLTAEEEFFYTMVVDAMTPVTVTVN